MQTPRLAGHKSLKTAPAEPSIDAQKSRGPTSNATSGDPARFAPTPSAAITRQLGAAAPPVIERFSKHNGPPITFPLTPAGAAALRTSNAVSPRLPTDAGVTVSPSILPQPTHPDNPKFWPEFEQVLDLQIARRQGALASKVLELPKLFAGYTMTEGAAAVGNDFPSDHPTHLAQQFLNEGAKVDTNLIAAHSTNEFVDGPVLIAALIGWSVHAVSPSAFAAKWAVGRRRPEEIAWDIHTGKRSAPAHIKAKVESLGLTRPEDFTAYDAGCPRHPSWPAMHSAASISSTLLAVLMNLTPEQVAEARRLDFAVSTFRSLAGVHYYGDNAAGLSIGQAVLEKLLPDEIARYAPEADRERVRAAVRQKLERYRYDWYAHARSNGAPI